METPIKPPQVTGQRSGKLTIAISSRALFDLQESHELFELEGLEAYSDYQVKNEDAVLEPGVAFPLARKLLVALWRYVEHGEIPQGAVLSA